MYLVVSALMSRPTSLTAANKASAFIFNALTFVLNKPVWQLTAQEKDTMWLCDENWNLQMLVQFTNVLL
jgi:hypothetical protein